MHRLLALPLFLVLALPAVADEKAAAEDRVKAIAPFLDEQTFVVGYVDLSRIDVNALLTRLAKLGELEDRELAEATRELGGLWDTLTRAGVRELYVAISIADIPAEPVFVVAPLTKESDADQVAKAMRGLKFGPGEVQRIGQAVVAGRKNTLDRLRTLKPAPQPQLSKAFAAGGDSPIQVAVVLPKYMTRAVEEAMPTLPPQVGGGSVKNVTRGFSWAVLSADLTPKMSVQLVVQATNAGAAQKLERLFGNVLKLLDQEKELHKVLPGFAALKEMLMPQVAGDRLTWKLNDKELTEVLAPMLVQLRGAAARAQDAHNLKQIGLAMHNYHDAYRTFPPAASSDKQGQPRLSWRVALLPFLEENPLYNQFKLDEPWDSEHNKKLIAKMPRVYRATGSKAGPGKTTYLVPVGKDTIFPGLKGTRIQDITDGTSNTILVVEVDDDQAVIWTRPEDLRIDPQQPRKGLTGGLRGGFHALFADGSVRFLRATIAPDVLRALFTRNGGEVLPNDF